jgi:hypothetical protein
MKQPLRYAVAKFVPDPLRGEVVNLGLIMGAGDGSWFKARFLRSFGKIESVGGRGAVAYAKALVRDLDAAVEQDEYQQRLFHVGSIGVESLADLAHETGGAQTLIFSQPLAALTDSPSELFEGLYSQLVGRERKRREPSRVAEPTTRDQLRKLFRDQAIHDWSVSPTELDEGGVAGAVQHPVDFALYNGRLRAVVHTVSFSGDLTHAAYQRAIIAEAKWDLSSQGSDASFTMLYSRAPRQDDVAMSLEQASVDFVSRHGITAVPAERLGDMKAAVRFDPRQATAPRDPTRSGADRAP